MKAARFAALVACFTSVPWPSTLALAQQPAPPRITRFEVSNATARLEFSLFPGAQAYTLLSATNPAGPFAPDTGFFLASYPITNFFTNVVNNTNVIFTNRATLWEWRRTNVAGAAGFVRLEATPLASNALLAATVLNRLTYGPTPDELARIALIGPDAYIAEQLAPWNITEDVALTHSNIPAIEAKFRAADQIVYGTNAQIADLRAWHVLRAVGARRQLLEILLQFFENHFVTEYTKSRSFFAARYDDNPLENALATQLEYLENARWRTALLNPACTFYDLLEISAESPAMIIYLDTVSSRGDGTRVANENYARELLELFTMGVDNGYDQNDVTILSRCWTGWTVELFDPTNAFNPFASKTTNRVANLNTNFPPDDYRNLIGVWARRYRSDWHNTSTKVLFTNKFVPARFGPPWTTRTYGTNTVPGLYQLVVPGRTGTNGIREGYEVLRHLADLPFTQEYISIKLCRLFVHDDFPNPNNDPTQTNEYNFYNYAAGNLSPEAELVKACMLTWETNSPRGQIWKVLETIFKSDLFRSYGASQQKVKTPLEFVVSAIRALRTSTNGSNLAGSFTAWTDGYAVATPLQRMGEMLLFDRESPDGYPEAGPPWISAGTLAERVRWAQSFCIPAGQPGHAGSQAGTGNDAQNSACDPVGLLRAKLPASAWTNATEVADFFLGLLFPGVGPGNLQFARQAAVDFLNDGSADTSTTYRNTPFAGLPVSQGASAPYNERVRGLVAMLLALPQFQEQ
ncbi:MAG: DUF1800 domain-containing protein [Verrucomicrobiae bacterium]|nr:DUF1800 domain-containing protein [Verrucomicrobiae bacterium]MDW8308193.1 DUF1800 family protein [Verrucomicrobiales bacterium]